MSEEISRIVRDFYNQDPYYEWARLDRHPSEFLVTKHQLLRYIQPGDSVLDLGGGPGRYALWLAELGCQVTLMDLSEVHVDFALAKAESQGLALEAMQGDILDAPKLLNGRQFDHVLVMGPLYHLLQENERGAAMTNALLLTKPGGRVFASFLLLFSGIIFYMTRAPWWINETVESPFLDALLQDESYGGAAFTQAFFIRQGDILPFMQRFGLEDQHIFGQESILAAFEGKWLEQSPNVRQAWLDLAIALCERPEYLSYSEHVMVHGRKPAA